MPKKGAAKPNKAYGGVDPYAAPMTGRGGGSEVARNGAHSDTKAAGHAYRGKGPKGAGY